MITSNLMIEESFQDAELGGVNQNKSRGLQNRIEMSGGPGAKIHMKETVEKKIAQGRRALGICPGFLQLSTDWCMWVRKLTQLGKILLGSCRSSPHKGSGVVVPLIRTLFSQISGTKAVWIHLLSPKNKT